MAYRLQKKRLLIAIGLWVGLTLFLSLQPASSVRLLVRSSLLVSLAHIPVYGVMAFLSCLYLRFRRSLGNWRMKDPHVMVISFLVVSGFGVVNEGLQVLAAGRICDLFDIQCNIIGAAGGSLFFYLFRQWGFLRR
ncbi:MAG: VanZ family protein [Candidatus Omnitrophica bacterium]|nr:VanZ family protein [Candidatus Omnitrophota bacterium]